MRVDWSNKQLIFGKNPTDFTQSPLFPRGSELVQRVRNTARNKQAKPLGRNLHAVVRGENTCAVRLYQTDVLTFTDTDITVAHGGYKTRLTMEMINEFLPKYGFQIISARRGPFKGQWFITNNGYRSYRSGEDGIMVRHDGTRINYKGDDLDGVGPNWQAHEFQQYKVRAERSRRVQAFAASLGFYSTFDMGGYKLPKIKDDKAALDLSSIAKQWGYKTVAEAWFSGGIMINDSVSEEEMEILLSGGAKLLQSAREDYNASTRQ